MSYQELMDKRSLEAKELEHNPDSVTCKLNSKIKYKTAKLNNNLWGKSRLKGQEGTLCTYYRGNLFGWKWELPNNARGVIGYPAIHVGASPWSVQKMIEGFPIRLKEINSLKVDYSTETYVKHKKYNIAFDLWLSSEFKSNKNTITTEIMVWEDYFDFRSYGKKVDEITTPFGTYTVMKGYLKNDDFGQDWQYFAFVRTQKRQSGKVDLAYLLDYLIKNHNVNAREYLTSVEFGNEIGNSSGFTLVKKFDLELN